MFALYKLLEAEYTPPNNETFQIMSLTTPALDRQLWNVHAGPGIIQSHSVPIV